MLTLTLLTFSRNDVYNVTILAAYWLHASICYLVPSIYFDEYSYIIMRVIIFNLTMH